MKILIVCFLLLCISGALFKALKPKIKEWIEKKAEYSVMNELPKDRYIVVNNIMLQTSIGITQIDHIVVSVYGIFVIESKNYKGIITGKESSDQWTKKIYGKEYSFKNPLVQNYANIKALSALTGYDESDFIPIVTFKEDVTLNVDTTKPIVYLKDLKNEILKYDDVKILPDKLQNLVEVISKSNID